MIWGGLCLWRRREKWDDYQVGEVVLKLRKNYSGKGRRLTWSTYYFRSAKLYSVSMVTPKRDFSIPRYSSGNWQLNELLNYYAQLWSRFVWLYRPFLKYHTMIPLNYIFMLVTDKVIQRNWGCWFLTNLGSQKRLAYFPSIPL